jgi:hypothetical protein
MPKIVKNSSCSKLEKFVQKLNQNQKMFFKKFKNPWTLSQQTNRPNSFFKVFHT